MMSPRLRALQASMEESRNTSPRKNSISYGCFNSQPHLKGHFYSANQLFARGVWIGYLAPDRQSQSFRGLPSFHDLKANYKKFTPPHPPIVSGSPRENRNAVCRGCAREDSAVIAFSEVHFGPKVKVVIMPLDGDDDAGVFAIMLPQTSDRSLQGLQAYRPYEISGGGLGDKFANNFMMLTLRNPDSDAGTLETVLSVLSPQERADIASKLRGLPEPRHRLSSTPKLSKSTDEDAAHSAPNAAPPASNAMAKVDDDESDAHTKQPAARKRRKLSENRTQISDVIDVVPKDSSTCPSQLQPAQQPTPQQEPTPQPVAEPQPEPEPRTQPQPQPQPQIHTQTQRTSETPVDDVKQHAPTPADTFKPPPQVIKRTNSTSIISLDLTDEQAERVYFIWSVDDEGMEMDFIHTLRECKSFGGLLSLLEEESEDLPSAASILEKTKTWKLTYDLGDGISKAIVARKGTETAFDRLQTTLAQASIWADNPQAKVDIVLKSLSRPNPA
ncbi:uncharacterized protein J4E84_001352 [Alternaria hordeiaustralica]|uniref:uncharacterized protein n=1 Tax=Alternaria hordeiaustralica TaxID=1187925 RepID=UPI0020C5A9A7|nr:uncharacterized protein J4E84_001352 [Alternaria hordeiaustralica]KAI4698216.1 hypothetical protein J4E84_001352 [Alternaria hordeiaustralica]